MSLDPKDLTQIARQAQQMLARQQHEKNEDRVRQEQQWKSGLPKRINQFCQQGIEAIEEQAKSAASLRWPGNACLLGTKEYQ